MNDGFVRVPNSLVRRFDDEKLTLDQLGLAVALLYREWRDGDGASFTLRELKDWLGYPKGVEQLRRDLRALEYGELTEPPPGKGRWRWRSAPPGLHLEPPPEPPPAEAANPDEHRASAPPAAPPAASTEAPPSDGPPEADAEVEARAVDVEAKAVQPRAVPAVRDGQPPQVGTAPGTALEHEEHDEPGPLGRPADNVDDDEPGAADDEPGPSGTPRRELLPAEYEAAKAALRGVGLLRRMP